MTFVRLIAAIVAALISAPAFAQDAGTPETTPAPTSTEVDKAHNAESILVQDVDTKECFRLTSEECDPAGETPTPIDLTPEPPKAEEPAPPPAPKPPPAPTIKVTPKPAPKVEETPAPTPPPKGEKATEPPVTATPEVTETTPPPSAPKADDGRHWWVTAGPYAGLTVGPPLPPSQVFLPGVGPTPVTGGLQLTLSWDAGKGFGSALIGRVGAVSPNGYTAGLTLVGFGHTSDRVALGMGLGIQSTVWDVWRMSGIGANSMGLNVEGLAQVRLLDTNGADLMLTLSPFLFGGRDDNGSGHAAPVVRGGASVSLGLRF